MKKDLIDGPGPLLEGRVAVITGSGGGIGAGAARLFARHGASVVIVDIDEKKALTTAEEITASGGLPIHWFWTSVTRLRWIPLGPRCLSATARSMYS